MIDINPINPKYGIPVPLTLTCIKTGKITKYTLPEYIQKKIDQAGSLEKLLATYVCREARTKSNAVVKTAKSWGGNEIIPTINQPKQIEKSKEDPVAPYNPNDYHTTEYRLEDSVDRETGEKDACYCTVISPKLQVEGVRNSKYDFRRKKA